MEKIAFLFAGQGSQYIGMGKDLYESFPESRAIIDQANQILGFDLKQACFEGKEGNLKNTHICQPAVLTVSIAALEAFKVVHPKYSSASFAAGLSLGEYSALVACGVLKFSEALRLVRIRAELMNEAVLRHPGKMAAIIGLEREKVKSACLNSGKVEIANFNCPGQIVISGENDAVDSTKENLLSEGAKKIIDLEVGGAFHSRLMWDAAMQFKQAIEEVADFNDPKFPLVSNVDALPKYKAAAIRENMVKQIYSSVLWEDSMRFMLGEGVVKFFEFGPGKVLKGLMRKIDPQAQVVSIEKKEEILSLV